MKLTSTYLLAITLLLPGIAAANKNPCDVDCTNKLIAEALSASGSTGSSNGSLSVVDWVTIAGGTTQLTSGTNITCPSQSQTICYKFINAFSFSWLTQKK